MDFINIVSTLTFGGSTIIFGIQAGRSMHEVIHYRVIMHWTGTLQLTFQRLIPLTPASVNYDHEKLPKRGNQLAALAPTLTYTPLLLYFLATAGIPEPPLTQMYFLHLGFLVALFIAGCPSIGDIRAFRNA